MILKAFEDHLLCSGSQGNGSFGHWLMGQLNPSGQPDLGGLPDVTLTVNEVPYVIPVGEIAQAIEELVSFFEWLFGGSGAPPTPRQLHRGRHPLYNQILGIPPSLTPTQGPSANPPTPSDPPKPCSDCHCGCKSCHPETMLVTGYDNGFASTGKNPGDPGYGITSSGAPAGPGTIAAPSQYSYFTGMYVPGYGCGTVLDRGGSIKGHHIDVWLPPPLSKDWGAQYGVIVEVCNDQL
jgi:3D (Asp-Asp-Asp) domain-containing protein